MKDVLVLLAHGSRDPDWRVPFEEIESALQAEMGRDGVKLAYMEFCEPTLLQIAGQARAAGADRLRLLPLFMSGGAHLNRDVPELIEGVRASLPGLGVELLPAMGLDPRFKRVVLDIARDAARAPA